MTTVFSAAFNVVTPNLLVCTKGALVLRDNGADGYVFALHVATETIEVYRLSDNEMLLSQDAPLELGTWYLARAELQGPTMNFFVDGQLIGTVTDDRSLSGAVGVAVQDTMETLFEDFSVTGLGIPGNGRELSLGPKNPLELAGFLDELPPQGNFRPLCKRRMERGDEHAHQHRRQFTGHLGPFSPAISFICSFRK